MTAPKCYALLLTLTELEQLRAALDSQRHSVDDAEPTGQILLQLDTAIADAVGQLEETP